MMSIATSTIGGKSRKARRARARARTLGALGAAAIVAGTAVPSMPAAWGAEDADAEATGIAFDPTRFSAPTTIDNPYLPLVPGTQFVLAGTADRGNGQGSHRVVFTVTDIAKEIDGVRSLVVWDRDFQDGALVEAELSFWAQDDDGNVWNMGEYPEEWEDGELAGAPNTWLAGTQRARAGIHMLANPRAGGPSYLQGRAPVIEFLDRGKVAADHQRTCVPVACYRDVLVTDEWNPLDQPADGHQLKSSVPGVGIVRVEAVGGDELETLVLSKYEQISPAAFAEARAKVFKLDQRAYTLAKAVWTGTPPAAQLP
jgi:hypothetical protein